MKRLCSEFANRDSCIVVPLFVYNEAKSDETKNSYCAEPLHKYGASLHYETIN